MGRAYLFMLLLIGLALRCGHTHTVKQQESEPAAKQREHKANAASGEGGRGSGEEHDRARGQGKGEAPPLAVSPAGLLQPGAMGVLQDKLIERGYLDKAARSGELDDTTGKALRDFQRAQGLPATGAPDDLTVEKLGLSPRDVFRASPAGSGQP